MAVRVFRQLGIVAGLALLLVRPSDLASCGPFFRFASFTKFDIPDDEKAFYSGQLGILEPMYWRRYLAVSYRILQGMPLNAQQLASIRPIRKPGVEEPDTPGGRWQDARLKVTGAKPLKVAAYRDAENFAGIPSCADDAFNNAVATLNERIRVAGADSAEVRDWLAAQDVVFANCSGDKKIPSPAPAGSSARIVADREYQIAAANFYAEAYPEAKARFQKIALDSASPWHMMAPYLAARADVRAGDYKTAQAELNAILADTKQAAIHDKADALLGFAEAKIDREKRLAFCGRRLLNRNSRSFGRDLVDYTFLYDRIERVKPQDEITTWIEQLRHSQEADVVKRWQQDHSLPWLVASMILSSGASTRANELLEAARQVAFDSPGWPTVRFHAVRLLIEMGKKEEARAMLQELTPHLKGASASTTNAFRAEHLKVADNLGEFLTAAPRLSAGVPENYEGDPDVPAKFAMLPMLDRDASVAFDYFVPLRLWLTAMQDARVPKRLRTVLAQAGFVRAAVLNDPVAADIAKILRDLKPSYKADLDRFLAAPAESRQFEAALWMDHHPEASIGVRGTLPRGSAFDVDDGKLDDYRDNWWCAPKAPPFENDMPFPGKLYAEGWKPPSFLSAAERENGGAELKALIRNGGGPAFLASVATARAKSHPNDPRLPEALAMAVRSSRIGCTDKGSEAPVKEAFDLLHRRFPNSQWAQDTPYWFK